MTEDLRCSVVTHELGERPAGSAGGAERYLLVELPLPWPKKIDTHPLIAEAVAADRPQDAPKATVLGIRSADETSIGTHRIIAYDRRQPFNGFSRREITVNTEQVGETVAALLAPPLGELTIAEPTEDAELTDVLLCTHGSRDRCCGNLGTLLHIELDCAFEPNIRLWRTSHTGGHRFAPTGIVFPSGDTWAYLDAELTKDIVHRRADTTELAAHYRGNVGISGRPEQIVDGLAFLERGWEWLDQPRMTSAVAEDVTGAGPAHAEVTATVISATGRLDAAMVAEDPVPVPICGEPIDVSVKSTPQFLVTDQTWS